MQSSLDRAKFRPGGRRFCVCFSVGAARCRARQVAATGEKHKAKQRKPSVPDVESRLVGKSSTKDADCSRRAAPGRTTRRARRRSLRRSRRHRRRLHWQPLTKQQRKRRQRRAFERSQSTPSNSSRKTVQDDGVFKQVGAFYPENDRDSYLNRRRRHAKCGGLTPSGGFITRKTTERQRLPAQIVHLQIAHRIPCKMQWFSIAYLFPTQRTTGFLARLGRLGHRVLAWSAALAKFAEC